MKRPLYWLSGLIVLSLVLFSAPALADVPSLQVSPLSYQGTLKPGVVESGFVDVANPSDESIKVTSNVQGFRQVDAKGNLAFYTDPVLSAAITVSLTNFQLGPRESVRDVFDIDPSKLPQGGVYAAIFFRTVPAAAASSNNSYVLQSANVGTLLILTNGHASPYRGVITGLSMSFVQTGSGLDGSLAYKNTNQSLDSAGFKPNLTTTVFPWGKAARFQSGLILPGVIRDFRFQRPGSYFGIVAVTVTDTQTGAHATAWVMADTGSYQLGVPLAIVLLILLVMWLRPYAARSRKALASWLAGATEHKQSAPVKPSLDGLVRRPVQPTPPPSPESKTDPGAGPVAVEPEAEPQSALEEATAADLESGTGFYLPVAEPSEPKIKINVDTNNHKLKPKAAPSGNKLRPKRRR